MKIFDCFMYFDEDVILDVRLNTLCEDIDYFVIVESKFTHNGKIINKIKNKILNIKVYYPSSISLASKFNCNSFHLSYPVVGTLNGWHNLTALKALSAKTL